MKPIPAHHKEIVRHLHERFPGAPKVIVYRDERDRRPIPIAQYGDTKERFYSTVGICDSALRIPSGRVEFATLGKFAWLPNALATSVYWLKDRSVTKWPLVCEDVVKTNVRSAYRHMAYVPSKHSLLITACGEVRWLLGVPIKDSEIGLDIGELIHKIDAIYPKWLNEAGA